MAMYELDYVAIFIINDKKEFNKANVHQAVNSCKVLQEMNVLM